MCVLATRRGGADSSSPGSGSQVPDMAVVLSGGRLTEELGYEIDSSSSDDDLTNMDAAKGRSTMELAEGGSGIDWKFANQGQRFPDPGKLYGF